jgi:hypothetical protein
MKVTAATWKALGFRSEGGNLGLWSHRAFRGLYDQREIRTVRTLLKRVADANFKAGVYVGRTFDE